MVKTRYNRPLTTKGWVEIGGNRFYAKSKWEANYAAVCEYEKSVGEIVKWEYEPDTFWFESIRRGVRSYCPDFKKTYPDGSVVYVEVKGYMDSKSKTKLNRMRIYHPGVVLQLVDKLVYTNLEKRKSRFLHWGKLG